MASDLDAIRETDCSVLGKHMWPELLGKDSETAIATIKKENRKVRQWEVVKEGTNVAEAFVTHRVRIWVDDSGIVVRVPTVG
ncbi:unnamed protein product [Cuscuta campestris]|uniref:Uncharacterized protein n=2 Tax=Cuscuta sect. Cleistogrammica TaxID=1824901 RepID=A0A484MPC9_9ASTE|nr:hypothetical protein DM860_004023 [Cuscuta australis]VFQ89774.1 unnamed protein product [Cuscuta campestris]VFQ89779.1 unnamed protein product [Cuscuta campestris]